MSRNSGWSGMGGIFSYPIEFLLKLLFTCIVVVLEVFMDWWRKLWRGRRD